MEAIGYGFLLGIGILLALLAFAVIVAVIAVIVMFVNYMRGRKNYGPRNPSPVRTEHLE